MRNIAVLLILMAAQAMADESEVWDTIGEWTIRVKSEDGNRCFASRTMDNGTEVQIGTEPTLNGGYFAIYNSKWTGIEEGEQGFVEFDFGTSRFGGDAIGQIENGVPGGYAFFDNPAFVQDFARKQSVRIVGSSGAGFDMDLTGTSSAIRAVLACQDDQPETGAAD